MNLLRTAPLILLAAAANADFTCRYGGALVETLGGSNRPVEIFYERTDPEGMDQRRYELFPPDSLESRHMVSTAGAGRGYLIASAYASFTKNYVGGGTYYDSLVTDASAKFGIDDLVISGPAGNIPITVNIHLSGTHILSASQNGIANSIATVSFYRNESQVSGARHAYYISSGTLTSDHTGFLTNFDGDDVITSDSFNVPANTPFKLEVSLSVNASVSSLFINSSNSASNTDFSHTLTFAVDRPVFNLPAGYTANSAQAGIVNNMFSMPCPSDFNNDGMVDDADFSIFVVGYNILDCADPTMTPGCPADINNDGLVDDADFSTFVVAYDQLVCP